MKQLPDRWTQEDIEFLLNELNERPILIADTRLGFPTIHEIGDAKHLGFGCFRAEGKDEQGQPWKVVFDGGGAMQRTPSGMGWCPLSITGNYNYNTKEARQGLQAYLEK